MRLVHNEEIVSLVCLAIRQLMVIGDRAGGSLSLVHVTRGPDVSAERRRTGAPTELAQLE
jgi:hypothetical protein